MKVLSYKHSQDMLIIDLDVAEKLPKCIMIICNDYSKTYDIRKDKK